MEEIKEELQNLIETCNAIDNKILKATLRSYQRQINKMQKENDFLKAAEEIMFVMEDVCDFNDEYEQEIMDDAREIYSNFQSLF